MKSCHFCGEPVDPKMRTYLGSQTVYLCDSAECDREFTEASRAAEADARQDAEDDRYGRYLR